MKQPCLEVLVCGALTAALAGCEARPVPVGVPPPPVGSGTPPTPVPTDAAQHPGELLIQKREFIQLHLDWTGLNCNRPAVGDGEKRHQKKVTEVTWPKVLTQKK